LAATDLGCPTGWSSRSFFEVLVFGCAYWRIADEECSATTLRRRRDEWIEARLMDELRQIVLEAYDRFIGLELSEVAVDCCITKAPCGGERAGRSRWIGQSRVSNAPQSWTLTVSRSEL
jgi:hypothetical protein